jgi:hypothetical protein
MEDAPHVHPSIRVRIRSTRAGDKGDPARLTPSPNSGSLSAVSPKRNRIALISVSINSNASSLSATLAGVNSAANGNHTAPTVVTRCNFQPYTQPCHPDFVQCASVSIEVCGTTFASRSFVCHTPPLARSTVLSIAAACPQVSQGWTTSRRDSPGQAICAGTISGIAVRRRAKVRRDG